MCSARAGEDGSVSAALPLPGSVDVQEQPGGGGWVRLARKLLQQDLLVFLQLETSDSYFTLLRHLGGVASVQV